MGRREWIGAAAVLIAVAVFLAVGNPSAGRATVPTAVWIIASVVVAALVGAVALFGWHRRPTEKATLFGSAAGILFGYQAAAMKAFDSVVSGGISAMVTSWSSYGLLFSAIGGFYLVQISLQSGALAPAIASSNAATSATTSLLGRVMYLETPHRTVGGKVASLVSLGALIIGLVWLAGGEGAREEAPEASPRPS